MLMVMCIQGMQGPEDSSAWMEQGVQELEQQLQQREAELSVPARAKDEADAADIASRMKVLTLIPTPHGFTVP